MFWAFLFLPIISVYYLAVPASAEFSLLANSEDGVPGSRCLPEDREPVLPDVFLLPVVLEENNWASHYIVTEIAGIIISEHIGHPVTFNLAGNLGRIFERTALPAERTKGKYKDIVKFDLEKDGTQLGDMLDKKTHFAYANLEVWTATKQAAIQKFVDELNAVKSIGLIGYPAREGWFIPKWLVDRCNALAYPSWLPGRPTNDGEISKAFGNAGETATLAASKEKMKMCFETPATSDCEMWMKDPAETEPQILVHAVNGYGGTFQEAIIKNNKLDVALKYSPYSDQMKHARESLAEMQSNDACGGGSAPKAVAFYHWEPSTDLSLAEWGQVERLIMPGRDCGQKPDAAGLYDWKCDFEPERLTKVRSIKIAARAPLIEQFLKKYQVSLEDMKAMLKSLEEVLGTGAPVTHEAIFKVSCDWVKANEGIWGKWITDRGKPVEVPFFAFAWDPAVFFVTITVIVVASIVWCLCLDGIFVSGRGVRAKLNWKLDFIPRLVPRFGTSQPKPTKVDDPAPAAIANPKGVVCFASPNFYDLNSRDPSKIIDVALLRFGDCSSAAEVKVETVEATAKAKEAFTPISSTVRFEPTEQVKWISINRKRDRGWKNEEFFRVRLTAVVEGPVVVGGLTSCNCIVSDDRFYPGCKSRLDLNKPQARRSFVLALLKDFLYTHGEKREGQRLAWVFYEAFYSSVVTPYLYGFFLLDSIVRGRFYYGFFILIGVEILNMFLERLSSTHQFAVGTGDLRMEMHLFCARKLVMPFFLNYDSDVDYHFINAHVYSTDDGAAKAYSGAYKIYKSTLQVLMAVISFLVVKPINNPLVAAYKFTPLGVMIPVCFAYGYFWKQDWRWKKTVQHEKAREKRLATAFWLVRARQSSKTYGRAYMSDAYDKEFQKAVAADFRNAKEEALQEMDAKWLSTNFAELIIIGLYVMLGLVFMESATYGAGNFTLGEWFSTIKIYQVVKSATLGLAESFQTLEDAVSKIQTLRDFLEDGDEVERFAKMQDTRMNSFGIEDKPTIRGDWPQTLYCNFQDVKCNHGMKNFHFKGDVPLGKLYTIYSEAQQIEIEALLGLWQTTILPESGEVIMPPWTRVVVLTAAKLPELFNRSAIANVLLFADSKKYNAEHARSMLSQLGVYQETSISNDLLVDGKHEGKIEDLYDKDIEPTEVSPEDRMLIVLAQVIMADPEVIIFDRPLMFIPNRFYTRVLSTMVAWQRGGPEAVISLGQIDANKNLKAVLHSPRCTAAGVESAPDWIDSKGHFKRTLVLNAHRALGLEEKVRDYASPERLYLHNGCLSVEPIPGMAESRSASLEPNGGTQVEAQPADQGAIPAEKKIADGDGNPLLLWV